MFARKQFTQVDETLAAPTVNIQQAVGWLRRSKRPNLNDCLTVLSSARTSAQAALILQEFSPERYQDLWRAYGGAMLLPDISGGLTEVEADCLEMLSEMFPLNGMLEDHMLELDPQEPLYLEIENMGWPFSDDEWYDMAEGEGMEPSTSVLILAKYLDSGYSDFAQWLEMGERMGWPEALYPAYAIRDGYIREFDHDGFYKRLKRRKLGCFITVFEMIWRNTGNVFFDFDPYNDTGFEFDAFSVRILQDEWQKAKPIMDLYEQAKDMAQVNPEVLRKVVKCWDLSVTMAPAKKRSTRVIQAQTLAEMWAVEEGTVTAFIADGTYGPIGPQIEPETGEEE